MEEDNRRSIMLMPPDAMRRRLRERMPDLADFRDALLAAFEELRRAAG